MDAVVECHSGHTYAERPTAFHWQDQRLIIKNMVAEWRSPEGQHFRIETRKGIIFELVYNQASDDWQIIEHG